MSEKERRVFTEPVLSMDRSGIHIIDREIAEKLEKKKISASLITGLMDQNSCAARWVAETFVTRELIEDEPDNAGRRGNLFHKLMEDFFALPAEDRTKAKMKEIAVQVIKSDEFKDLSGNKDVREWLADAVKGYYEMGAKPEQVQVAEISLGGSDPKIGLEIFVKGRIGNAKREVLGFIDRLVFNVSKGDGSVIIEDFKSGAKTKIWKSHTKSEEGLAEQRQQLIYRMLLEQDGVKVSGARLIYPVAREIVKVDFRDRALMERVVQDVENTDKALDTLIETNHFEYNPSFLCAWCPLAKICPSANIKPYEKMQIAFASQPEPDLLLKAIELN